MNRLVIKALLFSLISISASAEIRIGLMTDLTGVHSENGEQCRRGFEIAKESFKRRNKDLARNLEFIYEDSQSTPKHGVSAFQKLISNHKVDTVAFISSRVGMSINPISKRQKVPIVGLLAITDFTLENPYAFAAWWDASIEGGLLAETAKDLSRKRVAAVTAQDDYTLSVRKSFLPEFKNIGGDVVFDELVTPDEVDFASLVIKLKSRKPDVVLVNLVTNQTGLFLKELQNQNVEALRLGSFFVSKKSEIELAGKKASEGVIFISPNINRQKFIKVGEDLFPGFSTAPLTYGCYSGLSLILQAIKKNPELSSRADLFQAINKEEYVKLLDETVPIKDRRVVYAQQIKIVKAGEIRNYSK